MRIWNLIGCEAWEIVLCETSLVVMAGSAGLETLERKLDNVVLVYQGTALTRSRGHHRT